MNARFDDHGTLCIVSLEGEFIGDAVDPVRTACLDRVDSGVRDLILDLSSTEMVDSAKRRLRSPRGFSGLTQSSGN